MTQQGFMRGEEGTGQPVPSEASQTEEIWMSMSRAERLALLEEKWPTRPWHQRIDPVPLGLPLGWLIAMFGIWIGLWPHDSHMAGFAWVGFTAAWVGVFLVLQRWWSR